MFCHDGPLRKDEKNNYYGTAHNDDTFSRYYSIADELVVAIRVKDISHNEANNKLSKITVNPFEVYACPNISSFIGQLKNSKITKSIITEAIKKSDFVIIRLPSFIGNIAVDLAKKHGKPYLVEVVACPWDAFWNHSWKGKLIAPYMYYATKKRVYNALYSIYVTNNFLQKRYPTTGKSTNCSNVALTEFEDDILKERMKKISLLENKSKIIIGTTAAVNVKYKGQQYVIKALGRLKKQGITKFEYHLLGGGDSTYLETIAEKYGVANQVKFIGSMPHHKVFDWLEKIDIYVQPSRQEGLPRALIEAMSRGLPAFGANTAGIPELLEPEFIFNNNKKNVNEICEIIKSFDKKTMNQQSKRNYMESKKYNKIIVEKRRNQFFEDFRNLQ